MFVTFPKQLVDRDALGMVGQAGFAQNNGQWS